jgi:hypothetical protein
MATTQIAARKLGKTAPRVDVRTLTLSRYLDRVELPDPPGTLDLTEHVAEWPMYANDRIGDCTTAAAAHMIEAWTAAARGSAVEVTESAVLAAFDRVKITDPQSGAEGAVELDVLRDWRKHGVGHHRIGAFARVSTSDHRLVQTAAWLFGGLYVGLELPLSAQYQDTWDWNETLSGDGRPGSWGGHAVDVVRYSADGLTVVTWGDLQEMTWSFWDRYCDEAYCILSRDFLDGGRTPNGFDLDALRADLELVTA